jgi:beta-lactam-binding protein with PASTA domain
MRFAPFRRRRDLRSEPPPWNEGETVVAGGPPGPPPVVEEEVAPPPPPPPRGPLIWPWLLLLLLLVAGGLVAWWLISRDDDNGRGTPSAVIVPRVVGERQDRAVAEINSSGLIARVETRPSSGAAGTVFAQRPHGGARVARGSNVTLSVSAAETVVVPDVFGKRAQEAVSTLRGKGLVVQTATVSSEKPSGTVLAQSPAAGESVGKGSTVQIRISRGLVLVPDVTGQSRSTAVSTLRGAGLVPSVVNVPSPQARGIVVAQRPLAGTRVAQGSRVQLNVSRGQPAPTTTTAGTSPPPPSPPAGTTTRSVPDVTGQRHEAAQRTLNGAGFKAGVVYVPSDDPQGTVVSQSPAGGLSRRTGTRIQLNVSLGPSPGSQQVVPDVLGLDPQTARARLSSAGFNVQTLSQKISSPSQNGKVVDEQPAGGRRAPARSTVTIYIGRSG